MRFLTLLLFVPIFAYAQFETDYKPLKTYSGSSSDKSSVELITALKAQTASEVKTIQSRRQAAVEKIYKSRLNILIRLVQHKGVIHDDTLEQFVNGVFNRILSLNTIKHKPGKVLIMRETSVNAICYGEGTTLITLGLLSKIVNEGQLAFTLAHEIAHYELDHVKNNILRSLNRDIDPEIKSGIEDLTEGDISEEKLEKVKAWIYSLGEFSRAKELQADSLGFIYFRNAGYPEREAVTVLALLDSAKAPKYKRGDKLFDPLNFARYPFQKSWLKNRLSIYSKRSFTNFIVPFDSLRSHPEFRIRKAALPVKDSSDAGIDKHVLQFGTIADFELVESAFQRREYDRSLHYALQLKPLYPKNVYLTTVISRILTTITDVKINGLMLQLFASTYIDNYTPELKQVNSFLYNTMGTELAELTFNFLNHQDNFNRDNEESYFLLWKICKLTQRNSVKDKVKQSYLEKFPNGKFLKQMRER